MLTNAQVESLKLGIAPIDERATLIVESGLEWINANTTLDIDTTNDEALKALPSCVRLFLVKFFDVNMLGAGISSESIEGLSQSYDTSDKSALIWQFAEELLAPYLKGRVSFVAATSKWV